MTSPILLPHTTPVSEVADPAGLLRRAGILMTPEQERLDDLVTSRYCLVRIDGIGERWRCNRCGNRHAHFTLMCIERPFRGLRAGLLAYWQNTAVPAGELSPDQRGRRQEVGTLLGFNAPLPALADHHPETARALATRPGSLDIGAWVIGVVDPISDAKARQLASRINAVARRPVIRL